MKDVFVTTYTGRKLSLINPQPDDIYVEDIAHHLSLICRFNGACHVHYSVAQHSILVANCVSKENELWGLLHDAAEAYIGDLVKPAKHLYGMFSYRIIENAILECVAEKFNLPKAIPTEVIYADNAALFTEARALGVDYSGWSDPIFTVEPIFFCSMNTAEKMLLTRINRLI